MHERHQARGVLRGVTQGVANRRSLGLEMAQHSSPTSNSEQIFGGRGLLKCSLARRLEILDSENF